ESLLILASQENHELDVADIHNWVNYNNISGVPPQLSSLSVFDNRPSASLALEPIATLSLYKDRDDYAVVGNPHFFKAGYPRDPNTAGYDQLHFVINTIGIDEVMKRLSERSVELAQQYSKYRSRRSIVSVKDDNVTSEDMVL